jgi:hypothetical protein
MEAEWRQSGGGVEAEWRRGGGGAYGAFPQVIRVGP